MTELIVNPFLKQRLYYNKDNEVVLSLAAPKKETGVKPLEFTRPQQPALFDLINELTQTSFNFLDVEEDLSTEERDLLAAHNILLTREEIPASPLFACYLDEIEPEDFNQDFTNSIVNPHFYYEKGEGFDVLMRRRSFGMLPSAPVAWVTDAAGTGLTLGYWMREEFAEIAANLNLNEKPSIQLTEKQAAVLRQAKILVEPNYLECREQEWVEQIAQAKQFFEREKYTTLRQILPPEQLRAISLYLQNLLNEGFMVFNDNQVQRRFAVHNDTLARYFHQNLADLISRTVGERVKPSYVYAATYIEDAILEPHTDRQQCEFTMSMQIDYLPTLKSGEPSPWALSLDNLAEKRVDSYLACGDGLIYKGCELVHYRDALFAGHQSTSIFFHYVQENFAGSLD
jgi:hypothetical protein